MTENVRVPSVAGSFYPEGEKELDEMLSMFLGNVKNEKIRGSIKTLIVPHAGYVYSGQTAAYGYALLSGIKIKKVILLGPSHYGMFPGVAESGFQAWQTPLGFVKTFSIRDKIKDKNLVITNPGVHEPEHCLEVQVPFLQKVLGSGFEICPLLTGNVEPDVLSANLVPLLDEKTLLLISSDLSHYHSNERALEIDSAANQAIPKLDLDGLDNAEACGMTAIQTGICIANALGWKAKLLHHATSAEASGDFSSVVGYGCYAFYK